MTAVDVVIVGGGAAGLFCAMEAGKRGRRVAVLEKNERVGKKILISGGGRCNFTNTGAGPGNYLSARPDFCKSALARYTAADFVALVERHGIRYHEKKLGQLFCDTSSRDIVRMLEKECREANVRIETGVAVNAVRREGDGFIVEIKRRDGADGHSGTPHPVPLPLSKGRGDDEEFHCKSLVVATGGLSLPKLGASDFAYRIARQFGIEVTPLRAGLVPLTFGGAERAFCASLSGLSVACEVSLGKQRFRENFLFTHKGLSGPAILQISSYWREGEEIQINLLPEEKNIADWLEAQKGRDARLDNFLAGRLPRRFVEAWARLDGEPKPLRHYSAAQLKELAQKLGAWRLRPAGTEGYATAEVTCGGVDTGELSSKTLEARQVAGLYFIGEAVDVTGWLGGYNFQWAWSSGFAAGQVV